MISEILMSVNFWLVVLFTGAVVWIIRQVTPEKWEAAKMWKAVLKVVPALIGAGVACIPGVRITEDITQSLLTGFIGGTFSQTAYGFLRQIAPEKIKAMLGSRADRKSNSE